MDYNIYLNCEKYYIEFWYKIPFLNKINNKLNFRIFSIINENDIEIKDPIIEDSDYIFQLNENFINKEVFFQTSFQKDVFEKIKNINFGICDEGYSWILNNIRIENSYFK